VLFFCFNPPFPFYNLLAGRICLAAVLFILYALYSPGERLKPKLQKYLCVLLLQLTVAGSVHSTCLGTCPCSSTSLSPLFLMPGVICVATVPLVL
jgi:hypothetical protein